MLRLSFSGRRGGRLGLAHRGWLGRSSRRGHSFRWRGMRSWSRWLSPGLGRRRSRDRSGVSRNHRSDRFALRDGLGRCKNGRAPMIDGGKLLAVLCCFLPMLQLRGHRRNPLLTSCGDFRRQRPPRDTAWPVVTGAINRGVVDGGVVDDDGIGHRAVINLNVGDVHIVDGTVIVETISVPVPALVANTYVAEPIVNAAIVADMPAPKAVVVAILAANKSPISWCPEEAHLRRLSPGARYPVVALRSIAPISGCPQIAIARAVRLRILR